MSGRAGIQKANQGTARVAPVRVGLAFRPRAFAGRAEPEALESEEQASPDLLAAYREQPATGPPPEEPGGSADDSASNSSASRPKPASSPRSGGWVKVARRGRGAMGVSAEVEAEIEGARGGGRALEPGVLERMEAAFGTGFGDVQVHTDARADRLSGSLGALAFTAGRDIFFRRGEFQPESASGVELLAHELTHVVQQRGGGDLQGRMELSQPGDACEQEAERVAKQVARMDLEMGSEEADSKEHGLCPECADEMTADGEQAGQSKGGSGAAAGSPREGHGPCPECEEVQARSSHAEAKQGAEEAVGASRHPAPPRMGKGELRARVRSAVRRGLEGPSAETSWSLAGAQDVHPGLTALDTKCACEGVAGTGVGDYLGWVAREAQRSAEEWTRSRSPGGPSTGLSGRSSRRVGRPSELAPAPRGGVQPRDDPRQIQARLGGGRRLESETRARMESAYGVSFSEVRVHTDAAATKLADDLGARAFTVGRNVAFGAGEYRPGTPGGDTLLAHELAHVVQQQGSTWPVAPEPDASRRTTALEADADRSAALAVASPWSDTGPAAEPGGVAMPRLRSGISLQCADKCEVDSGPTYTPTGDIPNKGSGATKKFPFTFTAKFKKDEARDVKPSCCEVRQYIKWDKRFKDNHGKPHSGFSSDAEDTYVEDRDAGDNNRYGHRSGKYSNPVSGNQYTNPDHATGDTFDGRDTPTGPATAVGTWTFKLKVIDTCNGNQEKATSSEINVKWG